MSKIRREVRYLLNPKSFDGKKWSYDRWLIVRLGDVGKWTMVRRAEFVAAAPFVISRKDWDRCEVARKGNEPDTSATTKGA